MRIRNLVARTCAYRWVPYNSYDEMAYQRPQNLLLMKMLKEFTVLGGYDIEEKYSQQEVRELRNQMDSHRDQLKVQFKKSFSEWDGHVEYLTEGEFYDYEEDKFCCSRNNLGGCTQRLWGEFVNVLQWEQELRDTGVIPQGTGRY